MVFSVRNVHLGHIERGECEASSGSGSVVEFIPAADTYHQPLSRPRSHLHYHLRHAYAQFGVGHLWWFNYPSYILSESILCHT